MSCPNSIWFQFRRKDPSIGTENIICAAKGLAMWWEVLVFIQILPKHRTIDKYYNGNWIAERSSNAIGMPPWCSTLTRYISEVCLIPSSPIFFSWKGTEQQLRWQESPPVIRTFMAANALCAKTVCYKGLMLFLRNGTFFDDGVEWKGPMLAPLSPRDETNGLGARIPGGG